MSKRFIDTEMFEDDWFMELSKDAKLLYIYFITKCNHAGIIKLNTKLASFQTGIKDIPTVTQQLGNRCLRVKQELDNVYFLPKFIKFQYPGFPKSNVIQQESALKILESYEIDFNSCPTVAELLPKSNVHDSVNVNENVNEKIKYAEFVKMEEAEYNKLIEKHGQPFTLRCIEKLNNYKGSSGKTYKSDYRAILSWVIEGLKGKPEEGYQATGAKPCISCGKLTSSVIDGKPACNFEHRIGGIQ